MASQKLTIDRVVLDTNVIISALVFAGKPRAILQMVIQKKVIGVISPYLLSELFTILSTKFEFNESKLTLLERKIKQKFTLVYPKKEITVCRDKADNRVLETAIEGKCNFIITGDKDLLVLAKHGRIAIVTPDQYLVLANR